MTDFNLVPVTLRTARAFVTAHHRHNVAPQGHKFSVGIERDGNLVGVAIVGRPIARRQGVPPAIQYSIFEGGDVFVCPFCCADLARTEAGIPRKCPECGQPIERKQSHDRKKA